MRLDEYYRERGFSPTFADLRSDAQLAAYDAMRTAMFRDRLALPPRLFAGARLLEFGPDTGENALIFARWGASVTLAEPNPLAHDAIHAYFERFGFPYELDHADVLTYRAAEPFDFVIAEGFIHTVKPLRAWLDAFRALLRDDGMFVVSYYERYGGCIELALRALFAWYRRTAGVDALGAAEALYRAKWDSIPHTRAFASWVFDVLENPVQCLATYVSAAELVHDAGAAGFDLYASYPRYGDVLEVEWHKRIVPPAEREARAQRQIARSTLSYLSGSTLYLADDADAASVMRVAGDLLTALEAIYWADERAAAIAAADGFAQLAATIAGAHLVCDAGERAAAAAGFAAFAAAFRHVAADDLAGLARHTSSSEDFIALWGAPNHHAVGRALPS